MRVGVALVAAVVVALLVAETTMQPTTADRVALVAIFSGVAVATAGAAWVLPRLASRFSSLRHAVVLVAVGAVGVAAGTVLISAQSMFLSTHDLRLVLVALALGVALGIALASSVSRPLESDLAALSSTARRVAAGDLDVRTNVRRPDEVGTVAASMDSMIEQLAAAQRERARMETARRDFLAAVGHDLRTPLTSLRSATEALRDGLADDPDRYLEAMGRDLTLLSSLVDDLFLLARIESGGLDLCPERLDLAELADEAVEAMHPLAAEREIALEVSASTGVPVDADPRELRRVLRNLLDNAIRHSPAGGRVRLVLGYGDGTARVAVHDEGEGFPPEFVAVAFDSFTRADAARARHSGGAGLGLAITRGLVEEHGGHVRAEPGPGGHVVVELPSVRTG